MAPSLACSPSGTGGFVRGLKPRNRRQPWPVRRPIPPAESEYRQMDYSGLGLRSRDTANANQFRSCVNSAAHRHATQTGTELSGAELACANLSGAGTARHHLAKPKSLRVFRHSGIRLKDMGRATCRNAVDRSADWRVQAIMSTFPCISCTMAICALSCIHESDTCLNYPRPCRWLSRPRLPCIRTRPCICCTQLQPAERPQRR